MGMARNSPRQGPSSRGTEQRPGAEHMEQVPGTGGTEQGPAARGTENVPGIGGMKRSPRAEAAHNEVLILRVCNRAPALGVLSPETNRVPTALCL